ncbi:myb-like protein X [Diorhabda sublineata]|uniref:myb-like protein X n=1 Tax=Diorhabda sublineata TaxID=1163346 RepID=UPI0024E17E2D|nr:myb-like protein X [Diorhabda sublineata]XP_056636953.1 myb-like protein X [Diorhabda sublineata]XP_056636954.1 myb-like protein X [Diorhabda sublineata]XP_056636955.1 myb-like protein X [Diorhabda sublineata]XP_056636956.1 myb-like protein X [Diorhabda sublineata]
MASRVEQAEIKTIGPLSSTLELFDSFKSQEEDKDSDEESFHLPLLGCDDDNEMDNNCKGDILTSIPNGETEDDILNKYETSTAETADAKEEHLLLHEGDGTDLNNTGLKSDQSKKNSEDSDVFKDMEIIDETDESFEETKQIEEDNEGKEQISDSKSKAVESAKMNLNLDESEKFESGNEEILKIDDLDAVTPDQNRKSPENVSKSIEEDNKSKNDENDDATKKLDDIVEFMELDVQDVPEIDLQDTVKITIEDIVSVGNEETKNKADVNVNDSGALNIQVDNVNNRKDTIDCQKESEDESKKQLENTRKNVVQEEQQHKETEEDDANTEKKESDTKELETNKDEDCEDLLDISVILDADEDNASALSNEKSDDNDDEKQENDVDEIDADQEDTIVSSDKDENMDFDDGNTNSSDQYTCTADTGVCEPTSDSENKDSETIQSESDSQNPPSVDDISEINSNHSFRDIDNKSEEKSSGSKDEKVEISGDTKRNEERASPVSIGKRPLIESDNDQSPVVNKKIRMSEEFSEENQTAKLDKRQASSEKKSEEADKTSLDENRKTNSTKNDKMKTLITFEKFMKQRNLGEGKLTRSDLEQFCLQKICEALIHKTDTGELHQTIKKQEQIIESLRKDVQQLSKQTRDLDIVNKKLMTELRSHNNNQKPIVPLKITRSVGLQVKLNPNNELASRRKSLPNTATPPRTPSTPVPPNSVNRQRNVQVNNSVIRQVVPTTPSTAPSPRKTPTTAPILTQALQIRPTPTAKASTPPVTKRPPLIRTKTADQQKPNGTPGVIDLTDEDDRTAKNLSQKSILNKNAGTPIKIVNKNGMAQNKASPKGTSAKGQSKTVAVGQAKTTPTGTKVGLQTRTVTTLPQGVRLTSAQMKNGIAIPASVVTSSAGGTTQLMYVVQPGSAGNSGTGVQKAVLLNFQPTTNGVLTSALNGSTVSMIPSKSSNIQLKTLPTVTRKHPAPLPLPPPAVVNASLKPLLPKPHLSIRKTENGIILQWRMPYNLDIYEGIASYQLFAYQETNAPPSTDMWRKVGDVKALALPMACTLTQFADKNKYYFAVRSVDVHKRIGAFSDPEEISL